MNILYKSLLKLFSAARPNVLTNYERVRAWQRSTGKLRKLDSKASIRIWDRQLLTEADRSIPLRVFLPAKAKSDALLLYFHGGGWVTGDLDFYTTVCSNLAESLHLVLVAVAYRLAPEHPYPAGFDDCFTVYRHLLDNLDALQISSAAGIVLGGDSAGAELAAAVSLRAQAEGLALPGAQLLFYPSCWWDHDEDSSPFPSLRENSSGYGLSAAEIRAYMELYVPAAELRQQAYVAPLLAPSLSGQPASLIVTAEFDPLRDEAECYGQRLQAAAVRCQVLRIADAIHGFMTAPVLTNPIRQCLEACQNFLAEGEVAKVKSNV